MCSGGGAAYRGGMLITEQLFLLLTRDDGKPVNAFAYNAYGLAAAAIADLVLAQRISLSDDKDPRVHVASSEPTGDRVLDHALNRLRERDGKKLSSLVQDGKVNPETEVVAALQRAGVVAVEAKRYLGFVPEKRPTLDPTPERTVRERLRAVLAGSTPTVQEATLLSILQGLDVAHTALKEEAPGMSKRDLKKRIEQAAGEVPEGTAVAKAVEALNTVLLTSVIIPVVVSSGGSS